MDVQEHLGWSVTSRQGPGWSVTSKQGPGWSWTSLCCTGLVMDVPVLYRVYTRLPCPTLYTRLPCTTLYYPGY